MDVVHAEEDEVVESFLAVRPEEAPSMPADDGRPLDNDEGAGPAGPHTAEDDPEDPVAATQPLAFPGTEVGAELPA